MNLTTNTKHWQHFAIWPCIYLTVSCGNGRYLLLPVSETCIYYLVNLLLVYLLLVLSASCCTYYMYMLCVLRVASITFSRYQFLRKTLIIWSLQIQLGLNFVNNSSINLNNLSSRIVLLSSASCLLDCCPTFNYLNIYLPYVITSPIHVYYMYIYNV